MKMRIMSIFLVIIFLIACQYQNEVKIKGDQIMENKFIHAAAKGSVKEVLQLIDKGVHIDSQDENGKTAIVAATYHNHIDVVQVLLEAGADPNLQDDRLENVILHSGANGYLEIVKLAVAADADMSITNRYKGTALIPAAERGHTEVVEELLKTSDIDVNHMNRLHWTALLEAVILGDGGEKHQKIVQLLMDYGADQTIGDDQGITPVEHARERNYKEIVDILTQLSH